MNTKKFLQLFVLLSVLLASFASTSSAFAAPAPAGQCGTSVTVVSGDSVYKTRTEAEAGMKTVKVCTTN